MRNFPLWLSVILLACSSSASGDSDARDALRASASGGGAGAAGSSGTSGQRSGDPSAGGTAGQGTAGQGTAGQGAAGTESTPGTMGCANVERPNPRMADCGDETFVVADKDNPGSFRCVPVGIEVLDPGKGCVYKASRPLTCTSAKIGPGEFGCRNGVLFADGTLGFVSFVNTGCPLFDLPPGAVEQPNADPDSYPACPAP